jgi:hypothetical protein
MGLAGSGLAVSVAPAYTPGARLDHLLNGKTGLLHLHPLKKNPSWQMN